MPTLLVFAPCERVSYDLADQSATLTGILQGFTFQVISEADAKASSHPASTMSISAIPAEEKSPKGIPMKWAIFSLWKTSKEELGKKFTQICELIKPNGERSMRQSLEFEVTNVFQRNVIQVIHFPSDQPGEYRLTLMLQEDADEPKFISDYPISITYHENQTRTH